MAKQLSVLNIEDSESDSDLIARLLKKAGYKITFERVETAAQMRAALKKYDWDIIISDHSLPQFDSHAALKLVHEAGLDIPFITVSGTIGEETAVAMIKAGAHDFLVKDNLTRLIPAVERELESAKVRRERKQAQDALLESESRFRQVWEITSDAMALSDAEGIVLAVNPAYLNLYGYSAENVIGHSFAIIFPQKFRKDAVKQYKALFANDSIPSEFEAVIKRADGAERVVESRASFVTKDGTRAAMLSTIRDITERKQADETLRISEKRFRALTENSADAITLLDAQGVVTYDSPSAPGLLGYSPEEWIGQSLFELIHPDDLQDARELLQKLTGTSSARMQGMFRLRHKNNSWRKMEAVVTNLLDEPGIQAIVINYRDVTEREQAEDALHESEERFKNAFQYSAIGMALVSLDGNWLKVNSMLCSILGYSEDEFLTKTFQDITHPDDLDGDLNQLNQLLAGGIRSYSMDKRYFHQNGTIIWAHLSVALARDNAGAPLYFISQIKDITERKQIEEALTRSEQAHRTLFENVPVGLYRTSIDGYWLDVNPALVKMFGYPDQESLQAIMIKDLYVDPATNDRFFNEIVDNDIIKSLEAEFRKKDGTTFWAEDNIRVVRDESGEITSYEGSLIDITERKHSEQALHESEHRFHSLFNRMMDGVYHSEHEGRFIDVNPAMVKIFGYSSREEMLAVDIKSELYFVPEERGSHILDTGQEEMDIYRMRRKDGSEIWVEDHGSYVHDEQGNIIYHEGILRDITERRRSEEALNKTRSDYQRLFNHANDVILIFEPEEEIILDVNVAACAIYGFSRDELVGMSLKKLTLNVTEGEAQIRDTLENRSYRDFESIHINKNGQKIYFLINASVVEYQNKEAIFSINHDITDRKQAEEVAYESEARYRSLFEDSPVSLWEEDFSAVKLHLDTLRDEGVKDFRAYFKTHPQEIGKCSTLAKILNVNKATLKLFGAKSLDELSQSLVKFKDDDPMELFQNEMISIAQGKTQFEWEGVNQSLDGREIIIRLSFSVIPGHEETFSKVIISMVDITAPIQAEQAIRESEKSLRESQMIAGLGSYVLDFASETWTSSQILNQIFGINESYTRTIQGWVALVDPDGRQEMSDHLSNDVLQNHNRFDKEYKIIRKNDGVERWLHGLGELEFDANDQPVKMKGIIQDITERRQAEQTLRESEVRWRTLVQNLPAFIAEARPDGTILTLNRTQPGFSLNEYEGKSLFEVVAPESRDQFKDAFARVRNEAVLVEYEAPGYGPHQEPAWYHRQLVPIIQNEKIHSILMVASDITERKRAEEAVSQSEQRYRALFEDMPVSIWEEDFSDLKKHLDSLKEQGITDLRTYLKSNPDAMFAFNTMIKILDINQAAVKMYHAKSKEALLASLDEGLSEGELEHFIDDCIAISEGRTSHNWEGADMTLAGDPIEISLSWSVVPGYEADFSRVVVTTVDITERKKTEAENKYQLSELEALYENGLAISRLLEPKQIAQRMVQVIDQKLDWHHAAIRLYDVSTDHMELLALNSPGFNEEQIAEQIQRINQAINTPDKGLSGWVIRHGEVVRLGELKDDPRYFETYAGINSGLYVPIKSGDEVIGAISIESERKNAFTERDAHTLTTLANQAAISFINARLYQQLEKELDERHRAEEKVRTLNIELEKRVAERTAQIEATKRRLELATHAGQIGVWEYNPRENQVIWDERMYKIHQVPQGEFGGKIEDWARLIHSDDLDKSQLNKQLALTQNLLQNNEHRIIIPDGSIRNVSTNAITVFSDDGIADRIIGITMDITDRKQVEQSLRESENYARLLFDAVADPVSVTEGDGFIVDVNKAFEKRYHLVRDDIRGQRISEVGIYPDTELDKREKYVSEMMQNKSPEPVELDYYVPGDRIHTLELHSYPLMVNGRQLMLNSAHDITSHKKAEEAQRLAKSEMERALRIKNEFLATMSHELRTPLNSILGISESLEEQIAGSLNEKQLRYIGIVRESGRHLLDLINDILDLSKIEAGRMELDIHNIAVDKLCQASLRMVKELAQKKSLNISYNVNEDVKIIAGDERRLKQSLVNLLSNAVKFTPAGSRLGLEVFGNAEKNEVEFSVWDQGIGIAEQDLKHLFKPFVQLDAGLAREYQGTGLGLALVAQMANLHGGSIRVESEAGSGSRFTITLPWSLKEQRTKNKVTAQLPPSGQKAGANRNGRILLVEDTDVVVQLVSEYLRYKGYEVLIAHNGAEGVRLATDEHPNLILMDVMMPIMNGLEATEMIRSEETLKNTPIIALTALAMSGDSERCLAAGMNDYLSKPIQMQNLADMIEKYLGPAMEKINEK